jgi:hypothetical protein
MFVMERGKRRIVANDVCFHGRRCEVFSLSLWERVGVRVRSIRPWIESMKMFLDPERVE